MHYFVTGATGFVGGYVTAQLLAGGHSVTALVRTPDEAAAIASFGVLPHVGTIADKGSLRRPMRGVDGVFHVAGHRLAFQDKATAELVQVTGTRNVLEVATDLDVPKIVYTSTLSALGDTRGRMVDERLREPGPLITAYDVMRSRALFEVVKPMARAGTPVVTVLPGVVYGPRDTSTMANVFTRYLMGRVPAVGSRTAFCWSHVEDTADGHIRAMHWGRIGHSYIIGGPPHRVRHALKVAGATIGRKRSPYPVHPWIVRPAASVVGALRYLVPPLRPLAERLRVASGVTYLGDDAKARRELGWEPRSLQEGIPDALRWMLQEIFETA